MPIRNPFARRPAAEDAVARPGSAGAGAGAGSGSDSVGGDLPRPPSFERVDTVGSMMSSATSLRSRKSQDTGDYKMSVVNDSGVYLPPSPTTERDAFWSGHAAAAAASSSSSSVTGSPFHRRRAFGVAPRGASTLSRSSTENTGSGGGGGRSSLGDIEPFPISRESFDSYRRSFDISARAPVRSSGGGGSGGGGGGLERQSLDSALPSAGPQARLRTTTAYVTEPLRFPPADEGFEDVGLDDGGGGGGGGSNRPSANVASAFLRKHGTFFKFGSDHADHADGGDTTPSSANNSTPVSRFLLPGRKRAPSGQGAELTAMSRDTSRPSTATEPQDVQA